MSNTISPSLSDLFFNHTHEHWQALMETAGMLDEASWESQWEAIKKDAENFVVQYAHLINEDFTSTDLADDFMDRL